MRSWRRLVLLLIGVLFLGGPVSAVFAKHACDVHQHLDDVIEAAAPADHHDHAHTHAAETAGASRGAEPCHCHFPCSGVAQPPLTFAPTVQWSVSFPPSTAWVRARAATYESSPDLEGPFQPPRA